MLSSWRTMLAISRTLLVAAAWLATCSTPSHAQPDGTWAEVLGGWPTGSSGSVIYDPPRNRMLLLGPTTWELPFGDPLVWHQLPNPLGQSGSSYLMVYDPNADRILAVQPRNWPDSIHVFQLTLSDPMTWSQLSMPFSSAGNWFPGGVAFDPATNTIQIFGGSVPNPFGGPTSIVGTVATIQVTPSTATFTSTGGSGLGARTAFATAVDAARDRVIVYGGIDRQSSFHDVRTAALGSTLFSQATTTGGPPVPTNGSAMVDPVRDRMLLFCTNGATSEIWQLTLAAPMTWSQVATAGPMPISYGSAIYDPGADRLVSFRANTNDGLWTLSLAGTPTWTDLTMPHPVGAYGRVTIHDVNSHRLVMHGDAGKNDVWALSMDAPFAWTKLAPAGAPPPPRTEHTGVYDSARDRLLIFGGHANFTTPPTNDVWAVSLGPSPTWTNIAPSGSPPAGRYDHAAMYDPVRDRMLVWAGSTATMALADLWELTLSGTPTWHQLTPAGTTPGQIDRASAVYDPVRDRMLIAGGNSSGETWALTLSGTLAWQQLPTCPTTNLGPAYDPILDRVVAVGQDRHMYELSLVTPTAWRQLEVNGLGPEFVSGPVMVFDGTANRAFTLPAVGFPSTFTIAFGAGVDVPRPAPPAAFEMTASTPNPATMFSEVRVTMAKEHIVTLDVYDMGGRRVRQLASGRLPAGGRSVRWDLRSDEGQRVAPGVYIFSLKVGDIRLARPTVVIR